MSDTKDKIIQEVRSFFNKISWRKILTFLFFVMLSSTFWVMQIYRQKFEASFAIPVKYVNIPDSIVFENDFPSEIRVRIKDDGGALFKYYFTRRKDSIRIDVRQAITDISNDIVLQRLRKKLFASSELLSYYPVDISFTHAVLHKKQIPVIYDGHINLPSGYIIDGDLVIAPDSVIAYGSKESLDTLNFAHTEADTLNKIISYKDLFVQIRPIRGIKFIPNTVKLTIPVDNIMQKVVEVPVTCINLPPNLQIKFFPSVVKIPFLVGRKRYSNIDATCFHIKIDYEEIKDLKDATIPIRITDSPDYIRAKPPIPAEVEFVLEQVE